MKFALFLVLIAVSQCFLTQTQVDQKCFTDIMAIVAGVQTVIADVKASNWAQAEQDALAVVPLVKQAKTDCLSHPMKSISAGCIADIQAVVPAVIKIGEDVAAKNWIAIIADGEALLPLVMKVKTDCFASQNVVKAIDAECINDIVAVLADVEAVVSDVESFNIPGAIAAAEQVVPAAQKAIDHCGASNGIMKFSDSCVTDVTSIIGDIGSIVVDIKNNAWPKVFIDASDIVKKGISFKADCLA